jgi:4-aminobutyrate aminotransferase / (S)-3-amino-2-methylpropionate transaminase / 5-aminovalerate transaminase
VAQDDGPAPRRVKRVSTTYRRIVTDFPVPESLPLLRKLEKYEPLAHTGQPPVVWDRAEGFQVFDPWGNMWLDWSSGVLVTNAGHGRKEVIDAICAQAARPLLTSYAFPGALRAELCERLVSMLPAPLSKIFLLSTGSEAIEFTIKAARTYGRSVSGGGKRVIVSFEKAFHGRTLGAQQVGGIPALKEWIGDLDSGFIQVPFPDGYWTADTSFDLFRSSLARAGVEPAQVCAVLLETYQGGTASFAPVEYIQRLREWCDRCGALLVFDEVQAGFGRTGRLFGFEHYGVVPDLTTLGKGISGSLPLSAVAGRADVMDLLPPGAASSTHSGNPLCCAAALANLDLIVGENLTANAARLGEQLHRSLRSLVERYPQSGFLGGKGLVAGLACVRPGTKEPDGELARQVVWRCVEKGLLLFAPVGPGGCTIKVNPPLCITEHALEEGCGVFAESFAEILAGREHPALR